MKKPNILIVEDEVIVAEDLSEKLCRLGYRVAGIAAEGEKAVALADRLCPHLVLMDIRLGGRMDGIEAAETIRRQHDVPLIYLTSHSDGATLDRAKLTGPFGYILKPFDERELVTQIELALYKHRADREVRLQREWLRVTLTSIGDAVIATDPAGRVTFINPVAESLCGWKAEEAVGRPIGGVFRIVHEETGQALEDPVSRVLREGRAVALANHAALVTRHGGTVPIEDSAAPILDTGGQVIGAVLVFHDVTEKRRAEQALRDSERRLNRAEEIAHLGSWELDLIRNELTWSDEVYAILGLEPRGFRPDREAFLERVHPDERARVHAVFSDSLREGEDAYELVHRVVRKNTGEVRWVRAKGQHLRDPDGRIVRSAGMLLDITEIQTAREELEAVNRSLEERVKARTKDLELSREDAVFRTESIPHLVFALDPGGTIVYCNRNTLDYVGKDLAELQEMQWTASVHPEDLDRTVEGWNEALEHGAEAQMELRIRRAADGQYRWHIGHIVPRCDAQDRVVMFLGTCTDIHARKIAEVSLAKMSRVFKNAAVPIFIEDIDARILDMNQEAEKVFGYPLAELVGRSIRCLIPEDRRDEMDEAMGRCRNGEWIRDMESSWMGREDRPIPVLLTLSPLSDETGAGIGMAVVAKDVRALKRVEESLRQREKDLRAHQDLLENKNIALREVIAQIETEKNRIRGDIASNVRENLFPILERLSAAKENQLHVEMLRRFLSDLTSSFGGRLAEVGSGLTAKEKEICRMIKGGLSSKEIAGLLAISPQTVEKHRKNIRKKLGITARAANLGSYLDTL